MIVNGQQIFKMEAAIKAVLGAVFVDCGASFWYANGGWKAARTLLKALGVETRKIRKL